MQSNPSYPAKLVSLLAAAALTACVSTVTVQKATPSSNGIRYHLPQVFLKVTPQSDGTFTVETLYLPDPEQEYVIESHSVMGSYTLDVNRSQEGFLGTVSVNADSTGVAKQLIGSAANLRSESITQQAAQQKTATTDAKAAADKQKAALDASAKEVDDARLALQIAERKLATLVDPALTPKPNNLNEQITAARLVVVEAEAKLAATQAKHSSLLASLADAAASGPAHAAGNAAGSGTRAWGPVMYRVQMASGNETLREAFPQKDHETWTKPSAPTRPAEKMFYPPSARVTPNARDGSLTLVTVATEPLQSVSPTSLTGPTSTTSAPALMPLMSLGLDRVTVTVAPPRTLPPGDYSLMFDAVFGPASKPETVTRRFMFRVER